GGGSNGDGKSDGLGCGSHDCSGGGASSTQGQVLGALTQLAEAAGLTPEVLGAKTENGEETTVTPTPKSKDVLGTQENSTPTPKQVLAQSNTFNIIAGIVLVILAAGLSLWAFRKKIF
ncbi:MAG: hypothetical protein HYT83_01200, partial [Candidatus Levybacteria bacterium]|nr:hypothetical protein [Candidatus Levybacteria bacterium]